MADIKWIKITTDIFDDEKILLIEALPDKYAIICCWFKLLCFAGRTNNNGVFMLNGRIAYTEEMLATIFRMPVNTVRMALQIFQEYGMIEVIGGVITIPNWNKHQSLSAYEKKKEYDRQYRINQRAQQKLIAEKSYDTRTPSRTTVGRPDIDKEKEEDIKRESASGDAEAPSNAIDYEAVRGLYNSICKSLPTCRQLSESRKRAIKARLSSGYTMDKLREIFELAEASSFLKGQNDRNWRATFDWILKDVNMAKILDGNYEDRKPKQKNTWGGSGDLGAAELEAIQQLMKE